MNNQNYIDKKVFLLIIFGSLLFVFLKTIFNIGNQHTKIVFCNVGQGDAIYIRLKNNFDLLIDSGPDKKVLECIGKYIPFFDKKIELAILTHADHDHYGGLSEIIKHYKIAKLILNNYDNQEPDFIRLKILLEKKFVSVYTIFAGKQIIIKDALINFYWPPKNYKTTNDNDLSYVFDLEEKGFRLLFCGDSPNYIMNRLSRQKIKPVNILMIPHHGSKNGLTKDFLDLADPKVAVISVGKNNRYGHPNQLILDMIKAKNIEIKRTDENNNLFFRI